MTGHGRSQARAAERNAKDRPVTAWQQAGFAAALLDPAAPPPAGLRAWNGSDPAPRLGVYRNNVVASLVVALAETFAVVRELVGGDFFDAMARHFIRLHPPASPMLAEYGEALPAFIEGFAPAAGLPYLADIARLEHARVQSFHAADAPALRAHQLAARLAEPECLPAARVRLHPSVHVVASRHAVVSIWAAHQGRGDLGLVDPKRPEAALLLREDDDAAVIAVPHATAAFAAVLAGGATLATAVAAASGTDAPDGLGFDLGTALAVLIGHGALAEWLAPGDTP